jgi:hypothetical protein
LSTIEIRNERSIFSTLSKQLKLSEEVTMMDPPTAFSSLLPELVTKICKDRGLPKKDLIALRLTSKSQGIHLFASEEFAKRYFKNIPLA